MNTKQCGCNDGLDFDRGLVAYLPESLLLGTATIRNLMDYEGK